MKPEPWDLTGTKSNDPYPIENTPSRNALVKQYWHIIVRILIWAFMYILLLIWLLIPYPPNKAYWMSCLILEISLIICTIFEFLITILTKEEEDFYHADDDPDNPIIFSDSDDERVNDDLVTDSQQESEN